MMKKSLLVESITYFFILLFLYTGVSKLMEIQRFSQELTSSPLVGPMAGIITWSVPIVEILLAVALFIPIFRLKALYATMALMSIFTVYVFILLLIDGHLSCSCGGIIEELSPKQHAIFNSSCVLLCAAAIVMARREGSAAPVNWLPITSVLTLFVFIGWTLFSAFSAPARFKSGMEGRLVSSIDLLLPDSVTHFNTADIPTGKPFIIINFDPFCLHCQAETIDIIKNMPRFKDVHIYYVTPYEFWKMKAFYNHFKLNSYPNITIGDDYRNAFFQQYMTKVVPYTVVFDSHKRLKQAFLGQADANNLLKAVQE